MKCIEIVPYVEYLIVILIAGRRKNSCEQSKIERYQVAAQAKRFFITLENTSSENITHAVVFIPGSGCSHMAVDKGHNNFSAPMSAKDLLFTQIPKLVESWY